MEAPDLDILLVQLKDGRESVRLMAAKALGQNPQKLAKTKDVFPYYLQIKICTLFRLLDDQCINSRLK